MKKRPSHRLHGILTVVTVGLWAPVWIVLTARYWNVRDYRRAIDRPGMNRRALTATAILAVVGLLGFIGVALATGFPDSGRSDGDTLVANGPARTATATTPSPATKRAPSPLSGRGIGEVVRDGTFAIRVNGVRQRVQRIGGRYAGRDAQGQFVLVSLTVKNLGDQPKALLGDAQYLYDAGGRRYSSDSLSAAYLRTSSTLVAKIGPGAVARGTMVFDIPTSKRPATIELHDSPSSRGIGVTLQR